MTLPSDIESLLAQRYYQPNETWEQLVNRVVEHVCKDEPTSFKSAMYQQIRDRIWLPNSPCLVNAGLSNSGLMACFVVGPDEDTLEHHVGVLGDIASVGKRGGGAGFSGANIRAKGSPVAGSAHGYAYGPNNWAMRVSDYLEMITQGGFRSMALMYSLPADHKDVMEFINLKHNGNEKYAHNFNQSVFISDDFMRKATSGEWTHEADVLGAVADGAYDNGEPGLLFDTRINEDSPYATCDCDDIKTTNPCQPGFATVLTPRGIRTFDDIDIGSVIWSGTEWTTVTNKWATGQKPVYRFISSGGEFVGTENHMVFDHGEKVMANQAESLDIVCGSLSTISEFDTKTIMDGLVLGDGSVHKASNNLVHLYIGQNDHDYFDSEIAQHLLKDRSVGLSSTESMFAYEIDTNISADELPMTYDRCIPDRYIFGDERTKRSFLRGLFSANGFVVAAGQRVGLKATSHRVVTDAQKMLSSIGIRSYITISKSSVIEWPNGIYESKQSYDLNISQDRYEFMELIGFLQQYKNEKVAGGTLKNKRQMHATMQMTEFVGVLPVYDITVDNESHTYWTGGVLVSNCGEVPMPSYGSCNLGSININHDVFYSDGAFDFTLLDGYVTGITRFLDDVGDANVFPNEKFKDWYSKHRPVGIGIMGFADALLRLGFAYGEEESLNFISNIMEVIQGSSYRASTQLGIERGVPEHCRAVNRRNITTVSIAPTGSIGFIAGCSHGIEPTFSPKFRRTDERGDTYIFEHPLRNEPHFRSALNEDRDKIPSWRQHIDIQAAAQKYVDQGVSKTVNMLNGIAREEVHAALVYAWESGCKGITIYRDGSRNVQVLDDITEEDSLLQDCPSGVCSL